MIFHQSVFDKWPFEDGSVQLIATSPPYYSLRKYDIPDVIIGGDKDCEHEFEGGKTLLGNNRNGINSTVSSKANNSAIWGSNSICSKCSAWRGQYGLEPDFRMYIEHTLLWAKEAWRVLRDDGIFFLNIADSYNGMKQGNDDVKNKNVNTKDFIKLKQGYPSKCLLAIPEHIMLGLIDTGWTLRNKIIWYKKNAMPESVTDRFSKKYEFIYMFVRQPKYYFDLDVVREEVLTTNENRPFRIVRDREFDYQGKYSKTNAKGCKTLAEKRQYYREHGLSEGNPNGKNPGDVFSFPIEWQPEHLTREEAAYIAALLDGEGSITLHTSKTGNHLMVSIVNTHRGVIEWIAGIYKGGNIDSYRASEDRKQAWRLRFNCTEAGRFLKTIYPWIIIKKEQAKIAIEFQTLSKNGHHLTEEERNRRATLVTINSELNRGIREKSDSPEPFMFNYSSDVWAINTQPTSEKHYACWPEKLVERMILCSTKVGDIVLDPFAGSGTTLRVAESLNRIGYGIDLGYKDIQERRLTEIQKRLIVC